jgi:CheY-like chemotaxis protein
VCGNNCKREAACKILFLIGCENQGQRTHQLISRKKSAPWIHFHFVSPTLSLPVHWPDFFASPLKESMNQSPVFIVDSDLEDKELIADAWQELGFENTLFFFDTAEDVIRKIEKENEVPFLIISEISLPKISGLELKQYLLKNKISNLKSIPFVFLTANPSQTQIEQAYHLCTNGLFKKSDSFNKLKQQLIDIVTYWRESIVPMN